jgi:hypothetical protein
MQFVEKNKNAKPNTIWLGKARGGPTMTYMQMHVQTAPEVEDVTTLIQHAMHAAALGKDALGTVLYLHTLGCDINEQGWVGSYTLEVASGKHKNRDTHSSKTRSTAGNKGTDNRRRKRKGSLCNACIMIKILAGDTEIVKRIFLSQFAKGKFWNFRQQPSGSVEMFAEDLCGEVYLLFLKKFVNGSLKDVVSFKSYLKKVVVRLGWKEHDRLDRLVKIRGIGE